MFLNNKTVTKKKVYDSAVRNGGAAEQARAVVDDVVAVAPTKTSRGFDEQFVGGQFDRKFAEKNRSNYFSVKKPNHQKP